MATRPQGLPATAQNGAEARNLKWLDLRDLSRFLTLDFRDLITIIALYFQDLTLTLAIGIWYNAPCFKHLRRDIQDVS